MGSVGKGSSIGYSEVSQVGLEYGREGQDSYEHSPELVGGNSPFGSGSAWSANSIWSAGSADSNGGNSCGRRPVNSEFRGIFNSSPSIPCEGAYNHSYEGP